MANEFIKKEIEKERTGANISPINVDIQSRFLINPTNVEGITIRNAPRISAHENLFLNTLEKIAKESEELKLTNEKNLLDIEIKKKEIDFNTKWSQVQDRYGARYEEYLKDYNNLLSSQKELINKNKYLTANEKAVFSRNADISNYEGRSKIQIERNKRHIIEQTEIAEATLEQYKTIGATYGMYDDEKARENYERTRDTIHKIAKLSGWSDEYTTTMLGKYIGGTEIARIENRVSEIQNDPNSSIYEKEKQINQILSYLNNKQGLEERVDLVMEHMDNIEDKERTREYLKVQLQGRSKTTIKGIKSAFNEFKRAKEREAKEAEKNRKFLEDMDKLINPEQYTDKAKAFKKIHGRAYNIDDIKENRIVFDWESLGDFNNTDEIKIFPDQVMKNLKNAIDFNIINNDYSEADALNLVKAKAVEMLGNDQGKIKAFIRQYSQANNVNPIALYYGDKKPHLYSASQALENGKAIKDSKKIIVNDLDNSNWIFLPGGKKIYNEAKKILSDDPNRADEIMNRFIAGRLIQKGKTVTTTAANTYLEEEFNTTTEQEIFKSIPMLKQRGYSKPNKIEINNTNISDVIGME